jgi:hypothetical protein
LAIGVLKWEFFIVPMILDQIGRCTS